MTGAAAALAIEHVAPDRLRAADYNPLDVMPVHPGGA